MSGSVFSGFVCSACRGNLIGEAGGVRCVGCGLRYKESEGILDLRSGGEGAPGYDPHYFESLPRVEADHFWFAARREIILDALERTIPDLRERPLFDIGCGTGGLLAYLGGHGVIVGGACDAYRQGLLVARPRTTAPLVWVDEGRVPPLAPGRRLIGMFDVLEHIDDDSGTLSWIASILEPGGLLALTVPAHPFLFDEMDELACHRRRYTRRDLARKLRSAGLEVRLLTHYMAPLVPLLVPVRWAGRVLSGRRLAAERRDRELGIVPIVNGTLRMILRLERVWIRFCPLPWGSSLVAVASRPEGSGAGVDSPP